jgi:hypothetical protein
VCVRNYQHMFQSSEFIRADQQQTNICFDDFACDGWGRTTSFTSHHGQLLSRWRCGRRSRSRSSGRGAGGGGRAVARRPLDLDVVRVCVDTSYSRALLRGGDALFGCRLVRMLRTPLWGTDVTTDSTSRCSHAGPTSYSANRDHTRGGGGGCRTRASGRLNHALRVSSTPHAARPRS